MIDTKKQKIKEHLPYLLSLLVLTLLPRIYFATPYLFDGDPVNYYLGAKNLLEGNGYIAMGVPVIWPVGYSLTMVPFLIIWNSPLAGVISSVTASLFAVLALYALGCRLFSRRTGFIAALLLAFSESYLFNSVNIASDTHALLFILLAAIQIQKINSESNWIPYLLSGMFIGVATLMRYPAGVFFLLPFVLTAVKYLNKEKAFSKKNIAGEFRWITVYSIAFLLPLSIQVYLNIEYWNSIFPINYTLVNEPILTFSIMKYPLNFMRLIYRIVSTSDFYTPGGVLILILGFVNLKKNDATLNFLIILAVLGAIPLIGFNVKPRLIIPLLPFIYLIMASGLNHVLKLLDENFFIRIKSILIKRLITVSVVTIIFMPHLVFSFRIAEFNKMESQAAKEAFTWVRDHTPGSSVVITQSPYYGHFNIWEATGQDVWAAKYYSERKMFPVFGNIDSILSENSYVFAVINDYWQSAENARMMYSKRNIDSVNSMFNNYDLAAVKTIDSEVSYLLWKLATLTFHPDVYFIRHHKFTVYHVKNRD